MRFRNLANIFAEIGNAQRMTADYNRMSVMSTQRLSELGLERHEIAPYVFRKHYGKS
ncbi:hypothetical protein [Roseibium denhamense]|uniref:DUF1127 domain-containing protein n=1 Tax=Roseibium denhamense TaxID=76305 RepID=A0ABY1PCA9_9HYPH|nr:hypothetical protein [Roseibium denhamense]SMP30699.1 hypothetical protein SAMN06265374_3314 [Roseibium denhamense]